MEARLRMLQLQQLVRRQFMIVLQLHSSFVLLRERRREVIEFSQFPSLLFIKEKLCH